MTKKGKLIVIEGGSGSGKTTQIRYLKKELKGWEFYREPGSTTFGYSAARANLIRGVIIPKLKKGANIVLDRYWYSTYAYQGTDGASKKTIEKISKIATDGLKPDLVIFYDLDPVVGMKRKAGRKDAA